MDYAKINTGIRASLLDRLIDMQPEEKHEILPLQTCTIDGLKDSIRREAERLLNTRTAGVERPQEIAGTVIDYGVPDLSALYSANPADQARLVRLVTKSLERYEPRLRDVRASIARVAGRHNALVLSVEAMLAIEEVDEGISFAFVIDHRDGGGKIYER